MKTMEYINSLIKERDEFKDISKKHAETIRLLKIELKRLNRIISKNGNQNNNIDNDDSINIKSQKELDKVKNELKKLKADKKDLQNKYNDILLENEELKRIFNDIENISDSD
jgi:multidrug resistance efflux pump